MKTVRISCQLVILEAHTHSIVNMHKCTTCKWTALTADVVDNWA
jgi:hypothetical protein